MDHLEVKGIHLFGSIARGDQVGTSDIDILIVLKGSFRGDPIDRSLDYSCYYRLPIGVDLLMIGEKELDQRLIEQDPFYSKIWQEQLQLAG